MIVAKTKTRQIIEDYKMSFPLPEGVEIQVEKGQKVNPDTVLATGKVNVRRVRIDLANRLGKEVDKFKKYLCCLEGEKVQRGDPLVQVRGGLVKRSKTVLAPKAGVIDLESIDSGFLDILDVAREHTVNAKVAGEVTSIYRDSRIEIETKVLKMKPFFISGESVKGDFYILNSTSDLEFSDNLSGAIVFTNFNLSEEIIRGLAESGVLGIIVKNLDLKLIENIDKKGLWGMSVAVLESSGAFSPVKTELRKMLEMNDGKTVAFEMKDETLVFTSYEQTEGEQSSNDNYDNLVVGDRVVVYEYPHWGENGKITEIEDAGARALLENGENVYINNLNILKNE